MKCNDYFDVEKPQWSNTKFYVKLNKIFELIKPISLNIT